MSDGEEANSASLDKLISDDNISKNSVEIVKSISQILENRRVTSVNITINDIKGDNYNDNATNNNAGHDNIYNDQVRINTNYAETGIDMEKTGTLNHSDYYAVYQYIKAEQQNPYCSSKRKPFEISRQEAYY